MLAVDGDDDPRCLPGEVLAVAGDACAQCLPNFPCLTGVVGDAAFFFVLEGFTMFEGLMLSKRMNCGPNMKHPKDLCAQYSYPSGVIKRNICGCVWWLM